VIPSAKPAPLWVTLAALAAILIMLDLLGALAACAFDYLSGNYQQGEFWGVSKILWYFAVAVFAVITIGLCASRYEESRKR
jgi:hypothetical protein